MALNITFYDGIRYHRMDFINRDKDFFGNGLVNLTDFPYTLPGGMQINLGAGTAWVDGYRVNNDSSSNIALTVSSADPTNPRIDIIQIGHDDINGVASVVVKKGVPAASPVEPNADPNYVKLYAISVAANATSISSGNVTDRRALVPLNVNGSQISLNGAANPNQTNNFTVSQEFTAATSSILANQIVLGQTNNVNAPASPIYLASANAAGMGLDQYGNLLPINPSAVGSGSGWTITGKNGNKILTAYVDGTKKLTSANNTLDDGSGNMTVVGSLTTGSTTIKGSTTIAPNGTATSSANATSSVLTWQNSTWNGSAAVTNFRNMVMDSDNGWKLTNVSASAYVFSVDNAGKGWFAGGLVSKNNTLDDGSGNMSVAGGLTVTGTSTIAGIQISNYGIRNVQAADTRNAYDIPFQSGQQKSLSLDFKTPAAAGSIPGSAYVSVMTVSPWTDSSGGYPQQMGFSDNGEIYHRIGTQQAKTAWAASTAYAVNAVAQPKTNNGHYYIATVAGTSGTTEPNWPTASGATVTDGTVTWKESGTFWTGWTRLIDDDGAGNVTTSGFVSSGAYVGSHVNATNGMPHFWFQNTAPSGYAPSSNSGIFLDSNLAIALNAGAGGVYTMKNGVKFNTLDDGSGNMTIAGNMNVNGISITNGNGITVTGAANISGLATITNKLVVQAGQSGSAVDSNPLTLRAWNGSAAVGANLKGSHTGGWFSSNYADTLVTFGVTDTGVVSTVKNTLDDGSGNMSIYGNVKGQSDNTAMGIDTGAIRLGFVKKSGQGPVLGYTSNLAFTVQKSNQTDLSAGISSATVTTVFNIDGNNKVTTLNNTLDDGSGNMVVAGTQSANYYKSNIGTSSGGNLHYALYNSGSVRWGFGLSGTEASGNVGSDLGLWMYDNSGNYLSMPFKIVRSTGSMQSSHNTLDDGSGNMTIAGSLTVNGQATLVATNANAHLVPKASGNFGFTSSDQSVYTLFVNDSKGAYTFKNTLDDGSGGMVVQGGLVVNNLGTTTSSGILAGVASGGQYFSNSAVGDTLLRNGPNTNILFGFNGANGNESAALKISYNGGANKAIVSTQRNTLDDGGGNMTLAGIINAQSLGSHWIGGISIRNANGNNYIESFSANNGSASAPLMLTGANGGAVAVKTVNNTLDDGSGRILAGGYVGSQVNSSSDMPHFWFRNSAPSGFGGNSNNGIFLDSNLAIALNAGAGGVYTMNAGNKKNILDDGSGNMTIAGNITSNGRKVATTEIASLNFTGGSNSMSSSYVYSKAYSSAPTIKPGNITTAISYMDVMLYPYFYNVSTTGFSVKLVAANNANFGSGVGTMLFEVTGQ